MSRDLNQCNFIGRLGQNIDLRYLPNGTASASFSIACNDDYKDKQTGQNVERTNWVNIAMFGRLAEIAGQYLSKGSRVFISGKQRTRKWQGQDGQDRYTTEIVAAEMQMLDSRNQTGGGTGTEPAAPPATTHDDDVPF